MDSAADPKIQSVNDRDNDAVILKELRDLRASNDVLLREVHSLARLVEKLVAQRTNDPVCVSCAGGFPKPPSSSIWNAPSPDDLVNFLRRDPTAPRDRKPTSVMPPEISNFLAKNPFGNMPTFHGPVPFPPAVGHHQRFGPKIPGSSLRAEQPNLVPMFDDFFDQAVPSFNVPSTELSLPDDIEDLISLDRASANVPLPFPRGENAV